MACAITTQWGNHVYWTPPDRTDISHYNVYRRTDEIVGNVTTADVVAHVPFVLATASQPHFWDPFTAVNSTIAYAYWIKSVAWDGQSSVLSNMITATSSPSAIQTALSGMFSEMHDPTGFPNRTDSVISFNDGTRTFSISPSVTTFDYYMDGVKYTKAAAETVVPTETSGFTFIYYDGATLVATSNITHDQIDVIIEEKAIVAYIYWNTAQATHVFFGDERHGMQMDGATHHYLHDTIGLAYHDGLALESISPDQTGAADSHAQFGVAAGEAYDEDNHVSASQVISTTGLPIFYRSGAGGKWRSTTNAGFSVLTAAAGQRLVWNENIAGTWQLTEVNNLQFVLCHVFMTNENDTQQIALVGQNTYASLGSAQSGATTEIANLLIGDLPAPEFVPIGTVIFQTGNTYGNQVKARIRSTSGGDDYIDWRVVRSIVGGAGTSDHGSLAGLTDDDHTQYLILSGRGGQTIDDSVVVCGTTTINNTATVSYLTVTANASVGGTLHVSGAVTFGGTLNVSSAVSLASTLWVCGATTLNGLTVSGIATVGTLNVTANASVGGTFHASGATTFGSTVSISGITTINNNLNVSGTLTITGIANVSTLNVTANASVAGTLWVCGSTTLNGVTVSGAATIQTLNVTGAMSVGSTMHVCGAATLGSSLTVSGSVSINNALSVTTSITVGTFIGFTAVTTVTVTAPTDGVRLFGKISGTLTKLMIVDSAGTEVQLGAGGGGNAIYIEADGAPAVDTTATPAYLVFDNNVFSATTVGQCATVTIATDGIDETHIDWGDGASQVASDDIPIGSASDSSWADGILSWNNSTTVADALDDLNETMSYLAPADANDLSGALQGYVSFGGAAITKYAGRLSDGNINYKGADPAGTSVSYIIKSAPFTMTTPSGNMFNKADEGETCYYHAVGAAAYGAAERRISHTAVFSEADRAGSQSANTVAGFATGELTVNYVAWYNSFPKWQIGSAYVTITSGLISRGYNRYKVTRECGIVTQSSNDFEIFYDSAAATPVVGTTVVSENVPVLKKISGVRMYDRGSTWLIDLDSANNCFNNVYRNTYIIQYSSTSSLLGAASNIDYNTSKVTGASTPPACGDALHISGYQTTTPNANNRSSNARASFTAFNVYGSSDVDTSPSANRLVDSYTQTSGALAEYFDDEVYRMSSDSSFDDETLTITNVWTGSKTLADGDAQVYMGSLIYPSTNFNAGYLPTGQSANYSGYAANQVYCRAMYDSGGTPHSNGSLELGNLVLADVDPVGTGDVNVEIKLPSETGWLDLGTAYNFATFTGADGDGCRTGQSGDDWTWTSGTFSTANSGNRYYLRITIRNSAKSLTQVRELGW